ncbi:MAG: uridine kinase [Candidatus Cyclobacteriaceae bacterium M3_2C_046]
MENSYIVGITGGSASGKTKFLSSLINAFQSDELCLISQDNYYKPQHLQPTDENGIPNYDTPLSLDFELFAKDINELKTGITVKRPEYTYNNPNKRPKILTFKPAPIIIVEGIFVFYFPHIANQLNLKVFIDAKEYVKLSRRIKRDKEERGYSVEDVLYRYEKHVAPTYEKYIEPFKYDSDLIIPNNDRFDRALEVIIRFLKTKISPRE